jgi:hypothetical protein
MREVLSVSRAVGPGGGPGPSGARSGAWRPLGTRPRDRWRAWVLAVVALLGGAAGAGAQEPTLWEADLPAAVAEEVVAFFNDPATIRILGESRLPPEAELVGDVAVLNGPLTIAGRIRGRVTVINGDVRFEPGGEVVGDVLVVGGTISGVAAGGRVTGTAIAYAEPLRFRQVDGRLVAIPRQPEPSFSAGREFGYARTDLLLAVRGGYNRVEGLPIAIGPRFETLSSNPTRLEPLLIYRTESGVRLDADELGYVVRLEQNLGGRRAFQVGGVLRSEVAPIEALGLSDRENSLAAFLFHRDYRDYYERNGWSAYVRWGRRGLPHELTLEYRDERHEAIAARGAVALFGNNRDWRLQPLVAEGELRSIAARWRYDTRNETEDPSSGWLVRAELEQGLGGSLIRPVALDAETGFPRLEAEAADARFTAGVVDVRRYARLGPRSRLGFRVLAAGSVDGGPLPPQRQHALGGEGSLPAYPILSFDCGARRHTVEIRQDTFFPYYGCDRVALVQLEYRISFARLTNSLGRMLGWDFDLGDTPAWVLFFDAGRAWTEDDARQGRTGGQSDFAADAGLGFRLGHLGLYWAVPLSGGGQGINFFVRIGSGF